MENLPKDRPRADADRSLAARHAAERARHGESLFPGLANADAANDTRMSQLARTIEHEIIPRLMLAHRALPGQSAEPELVPGASLQPFGAADVERFTRLVLAPEEDLALESLDQFRRAGVPIDAIYLQLLAPTARFLGDLWAEDLCSFTDVTVGLGRLQRVLRELSPMFGRTAPHPFDGRRALLLPCPGEQHTFGLSMVAEFFRHAGWDVAGDTWGGSADPVSIVAGEWFDVAGFSLGAEVHLPVLAQSIRAVRQAACNRHLSILVGGPLFADHPDFVERVGADGATIDGREAPALAERLMARAASSRALAQAQRSAGAGSPEAGR